MAGQPPSLKSRRLIRAFDLVGIDPSARSLILISLFAVLAVAFFADGVEGLLDLWLEKTLPGVRGKSILLAVKILPLILLLIWGWVRARHADRRTIPVAREIVDPPAKPVLVLFLSHPGADADLIAHICSEESGRCDLRFPDTRENFAASWRMPLEAVNKHLPMLQMVIVVPSADVSRPGGQTQPGTIHEAPLFVRLLRRLLEGHHDWVEVRTLDECLPRKAYAEGVSYDSLSDIMDALNRIVLETSRPGTGTRYDPSEFCIDITSGTKTASAAATAFALATETALQYVGTNDYTVRGFEIGFDEAGQ